MSELFVLGLIALILLISLGAMIALVAIFKDHAFQAQIGLRPDRIDARLTSEPQESLESSADQLR